MPYPYITQTQLEARISAQALRRCLDDDNDGDADTATVTQFLTDASSKVRTFLAGNHSAATLAAIVTTTPDEVVRLALDVAQAMLAMRHPEVFRIDGEAMMRVAVTELKALRLNEIAIAGITAENEGGENSIGDPNDWDEDDYEPFFQYGMGDF
jgi:phage gp36-like protein